MCYLFEFGYVKIGCIIGLIDIVVSVMCVYGFICVMVECGVDIVLGVIVESDFLCLGGYYVVLWLFELVWLSVIFVGNDLMGVGVLCVVVECGMCVFDDCLIIGFDDIEFFCYMYLVLLMVG